ncbi:MAG TPA: hypothetical protein VIW27_02330 [Gammaproteobacteria bacterium]
MQTLTTDFPASRSLVAKLKAVFTRRSWRGVRRKPAAAAHRRGCFNPDAAACGGYNEAFVIQYWAGYNPRH